MKIDLVSARHSPVRLIKDGRELRQFHGAFDMFDEKSGAISLDELTSVSVVAPYNRPSRRSIWFLFGLASGILGIILGIDPSILEVAISLPIAFAIVLSMIPSGSSTAQVLVRIVSSGRPHMLAMAREDLSRFRQEVPGAEWDDEEQGMRAKPLKPRERLRLKLMQIGLAMGMVSLSSGALIYLQDQPGLLPLGHPAGDALVTILAASEAVALILFVACWVVWVRTTLRARRQRN
ncbi:hypothetical protein [Sphingomonas sp. 3-13AW]|uniref:hypothetical protein n=1 Tax=Sphingomonas sp. 3-13AW TaxID=3050450 RepID=UPI003BB7FC7A